MGSSFNTKLFNLRDYPKNVPLSLFRSEEFYWLTTSISLSFALEELEAYYEKFPYVFSKKIEASGSKQFIILFEKSLQNKEFLLQQIDTLKKMTLEEVDKLLDFILRDCYLFSPLKGLILGKTYATYFLIYKLIELEGQEVLDKQEADEIYMLLDVVINEHKELEEIEKILTKGHNLDRDKKAYLYSHYQRDRLHWLKLSTDLELLASGFIKYKYFLK